MIIKSMGTALVLTAAATVLSGGGCLSSGGGGGGGGGGDEFFGQTFSESPNRNLTAFLDEADGEKIGITQHTGSMTLTDVNLDDAEDIIDFLFFGGVRPVLDPGAGTIDATADGSDENPAHFELTDTEDNDFIFHIASTGDLEMKITSPDGDGFIDAETIDDTPAVGDDVAELRATNPGVGGPFGVLNYMSVVAWVTTGEPAEDATEVTVEFGLGHMGLATPADDIPTTGTAEYSGDFVGILVRPGTDGDGLVATATGEAAFTADFELATVDGGVTDIMLLTTNLDGVGRGPANVGGIDFDLVEIDGNTFTGGVVPSSEVGFSNFDPDSTGTLDGTFYGPVEDGFDDTEGSAEAGAVLTLYDAESDAFITGVIGATLDVDGD